MPPTPEGWVIAGCRWTLPNDSMHNSRKHQSNKSLGRVQEPDPMPRPRWAPRHRRDSHGALVPGGGPPVQYTSVRDSEAHRRRGNTSLM